MEELLARGFQDLVLVHQSPNSSVYRASHPSCPKCTPQVAIKLQSLPSAAALQHAYREIVIMESLQGHPNIIQLCEYFESRAPDGSCLLAIVTEWREKYLMQDMIQRKTNEYPWSEKAFRHMASNVIHALAFAERLGIVHRDIKPQNIFYSTIKKVAKLGDFGSATRIYNSTDALLVGTPAYMSAELKSGMRQGQQRVIHDMVKADVYSLGLTLVVLASFEPPAMKLIAKKQAERIQQIVANLLYSEQVKWMLWEMVNPDCELRPTFMQLESKYCPLEENMPLQQYLPQGSSISPVIYLPQIVQPDSHPFVQPQYLELIPESPAISVLESQPAKNSINQIDLSSVHQTFQCCESQQLAISPVFLHCSTGVMLRFCQMSCYVQFVERETREYTKMQINCPICQIKIEENAVVEPFGENIDYYRAQSYKKGLKCVSCKKHKATHTIECGHLYCKPCLQLYKTPLLRIRTYMCADCGLTSTKKAEKLEKKSLFSELLICEGDDIRSDGSEDI